MWQTSCSPAASISGRKAAVTVQSPAGYKQKEAWPGWTTLGAEKGFLENTAQELGRILGERSLLWTFSGHLPVPAIPFLKNCPSPPERAVALLVGWSVCSLIYAEPLHGSGGRWGSLPNRKLQRPDNSCAPHPVAMRYLLMTSDQSDTPTGTFPLHLVMQRSRDERIHSPGFLGGLVG